MKLTLERQIAALTCTLGSLFVDDEFECFTLEDVVREIPNVPVERWKIPGKTAIPAGTYPVQLTFSNRFRKVMPQLIDVPGFAGIRIHPGNTDADTEGCILLGTEIGHESILRSRDAYAAFLAKLEKAIANGEAVTIEIVDRVD